ncbi:TetR/AcrR family transcriptional regulator [Dactylosporangium aurantiacum]|uniref:TetR/AcrR family transcriptional regulator n=1 Tax=Dactylosporangium aurantiacum TaxID=35754 RepID=A0A9Q9MEJ0_9ACTN|nr:TetR/AcrR family transcriptional regulator [Dactylosporangium aurantiacum]MDG6107196.1 helix-turn-helix domain containing protein [Dactylosporangium aurantiacum]UWZ51490.1 TetR/AcrR family transcriptional regulator [Dactylosporangium aurantiacum]
MDTTQSRAYRSPRRQAQAEATRAAITRAAARLFADRGYAGTTMQAIADEAGVAVESVYKAGSKAQLLRRAHDEAVAGDDRPIPLLERDELRAAFAEDDQRALIRAFARAIAGRARTLTPLSSAFVQAAGADPAIGATWEELEAQRRIDMGRLVEAVAARGPLRDGLTVDRGTTLLWTVLNHQAGWLITQQLGWSDEQVADWIVELLTCLLLPSA